MIFTLSAFFAGQNPAVTLGGIWSFVSGPQTITINNNSTINLTGLAQGVYTLRYTVTSEGCPTFATDYTMTVETTPYAGEDTSTIVCNEWGN